jgi:hypothetical protein
MRKLFLLVAVVSLLFAYAGCSSSSKLPTQPNSPDLPQADYSTPETDLLYSGTFEIDIETQTITQTDRKSDIVYDITWLLPDKCPGGCFRFTIVGMVGSVLEIELTLENPLTIQAYDLRVEYLNLYGKVVLNPDSYTDFLGSQYWDIHPFTAFAKEIPDRAFPVGPGGIDTEMLFLDCPPGSGSYVNYAITAHLPGMTPEPYEIGDMTQSGELTPDGGSATIRCRVDDHQDDVSNVFLVATPFTGAPVEMLPDAVNPGYWTVDISNTEGAPIGDYIQLIMALSPNPQNVSTYNYVTISVTEQGMIETIVYCADGPAAGRQIYSIDPEGVTTPEQWTQDTGFIECPRISSCGEYIMYTRGFSAGMNGDIMMIDVATGDITEITPSGMEGVYGDFSHDGARIVSAMGTNILMLDLWTMDYDGGNPEQLTFGADAWSPSYNFDDSKIYFQQFANSQIYIYDVDSGGLTQYTDNGTWNDDPEGCLNGTHIVWATHYGNSCRWVYISPIEAWDPPDKIINFDSCVRSPGYSPDGTKLVVDHGGFAAAEIAIYDLETDNWWDITGNAWGDYMANWGYIIPH